MDSKLKCVHVIPDNNMVTSNGSAPSSLDHVKTDPYQSVSRSVSVPPPGIMSNRSSMSDQKSPNYHQPSQYRPVVPPGMMSNPSSVSDQPLQVSNQFFH